jgi:hypothetical protein
MYERPEIPPLSGPVNDVALVRWVLKHYFGIPNEDIRVVVNQRATKANILHRLRVTVEAAEEGDCILFYFSGHGSQIRDRDGDELTDSLDELICPYDMDWDRATYILDDDLDALFAEIPDGVLLEVLLDCCFWGAGSRELELDAAPPPEALRRDVRFLPPPLDIASRVHGEEEQLAYHSLSGCHCFRGRNVLWAASREGELAMEDYVDGRTQGVFTYWGCRFLEANIDRIFGQGYSREQLLDDLRAYIASLGYAQSPELAAPLPLLEAGPFSLGDEWSRLGSRRAGRSTR